MFRATFVCLIVLFAGISAHARDWPSFRGPSSSGVAAGAPPTSWNVKNGDRVAWRTAIPGLGHSSPIVWQDRVFVSTAVAMTGSDVSLAKGDSSVAGIDSATDTGEHEWRLYAIDRASGRIAWQTVAHRGPPRIKRHVKASHASATPATNGQVIVALMGSEGLFAFDMNGRPLWRTDLGLMDTGLVDDPTYQWGPASSPVIFENRVLVQNDRHRDSFLAAYDLATGKEVWRSMRDEMPSWATPLVARVGTRAIVVTNSPRGVRGHDLATGKEIWRVADETQVKVPSPVLSGTNVIATGGYAAGTRPTFAIPLASTGSVSDDRLAWRIDRGSPYTSTPLVYDGLLYIVTDAGVLSAYDAATGARIYQQRLGSGGIGISASPVAASGRIYVVSEDGDVFVVRAGRTFELLATNDLGELAMATPAIDGNLLILRGRSHLIAVGSPS
ncbi:MAG TPA: PQQ-binding-like beta-propeller repeat protein [Vicinamibacterales bacterium]|nr:PQQ-binding-like beta-propeller repeat protein [Vicinamibacterales bacterium]